MSEAFLDVKDLAVQYTSGGAVIHAVNGVSFSLKKGKTLALVGETGAGKTTIAKSILRILPNPQGKVLKGSVELEGEDLLQLPEAKMRKIRGKNISMIFQDPMTALNPVMKVGEQIAEVIRKHETDSASSAIDQAAAMLEMVGIPGMRSVEYPHQFSGGMKQRVVIAMALACNPDLLIADEPTTALDVTIQAQILEMMNALIAKRDTSMILITHDLGVVGQVCDYVAVVYAGEILEYGSKEDVFLRPAHPYTVGLFGAVPDLKKKTSRLTNIMGLPPDPSDLPAGCCFHPRCPSATDECRGGKHPLADIGAGHLCSCRYAKREGGLG
jgi:peptide/nickel transport system ATP-binding protein